MRSLSCRQNSSYLSGHGQGKPDDVISEYESKHAVSVQVYLQHNRSKIKTKHFSNTLFTFGIWRPVLNKILFYMQNRCTWVITENWLFKFNIF